MDEMKCKMCGHAHKDDGTCDCGCSGKAEMTCANCGHEHKGDGDCHCGCA